MLYGARRSHVYQATRKSYRTHRLPRRSAKGGIVSAKAKERTELADAGCAQGQTGKPSSRLKQVRWHLMGYAHQLRALAARHAVPEQLREALAERHGDSHGRETLRKALRCSSDARRP